MPPIAARCLVPWCVAMPFWFAYTSPPVANMWPLLFAWACGLVLVWMASLALWGQRDISKAWAQGLLLGAAVAAVIGCLQYTGTSPQWSWWPYGAETGQSGGPLRQRNQQATLLVLGAWSALWLHTQNALQPSKTPDLNCWRVAINAALVALLAIACAATVSRTGAVQWLVLLALAVCWRRSLGRPLLVWTFAGLLLYLLAAWAWPLVLSEWAGIEAQGLFNRLAGEAQVCMGRKVLWSNMLHLIAERPWWGWGWGELDYAHYMTNFAGPRFCALVDNAHNLPMHLAVELGVPLTALLSLGALVVVGLARPWAETDLTRQLAWGALAVLLVHSMLEYPLWYGPFQWAALVAAAFLLWPWLARMKWLPRAALGLWVLAWVVVVYNAHAYHRVSQIYQPSASGMTLGQAMHKARQTGLFADEVDFAELTTMPVTAANAARVHTLASDLLHFSPEPRVIERLIVSARLLGLNEEAALHEERFARAYPSEYASSSLHPKP